MRSALITGASTGIGRATALRLASAGWRVYAGVRREDDGEALREAASGRLTPIMLDIADPSQIAAAGRLLRAELPGAGLDGLVNNAGIAIPSPLETMRIEDFRRQVEINLTGQVAVTQAMLPLLRESAGTVVFISSIGGRIAFPLFGAYHAAKFGLEAVGDVFRQELRPWGISVSLVEPGSIATSIWERGEQEGDAALERASAEQRELYGAQIAAYRKSVRAVADRGIPPERVARVIERALSSKRPRSRYLVGLDAKVQARIKPLLPTPLFDRIVARFMGG